MAEHRPEDRIEYSGELEPVFERASAAYGLGNFQGYAIMPVGYEDFNAAMQTDQGKYFIKIFASHRTPEEIVRYDALMQAVLASGINHPQMYSTDEGLVRHDTDSGLAMVAMDFVNGQTFYEQGRSPNDSELKLVLGQAALINKVPHQPEYLFDSWAINNLATTYKPARKYIGRADRAVVERIIQEFEDAASDTLPHCLVHGDIAKSNVLQGENGEIYVLDFSVANWYPRIQELAVIAGSLLNDERRQESLLHLLQEVITGYVEVGGELTELEAYVLPVYTRAVYAAEFVGAMREKFLHGNDTEQTEHWLRLGRLGLDRAYES